MLLITIAFTHNAFSQTCPVPLTAKYGLYSYTGDSTLCVTQGQPFTEQVFFRVPYMADNFVIEYIKADSLGNLPSGTTVTFDKPSSYEYQPGERGCATISGIAPVQWHERIFFYIKLKVVPLPEVRGDFYDMTTFMNLPSDSVCTFLAMKANAPNVICNLKIVGNIYADMNNDCNSDTSDFSITNHKITLNGVTTSFANASGNYVLYPDTFGSHTIEIDTSVFEIGCGTVSRVVNISPQTQVSTGNDFAMKPNTQYRDLAVTFNSFGWWLFGFTGKGNIVYRNNAFVPVDATIRMKYDSITRFVQSLITPSFLDTVNRIIEWQVSNIPARSQGNILVEFQLPLPTVPLFQLRDTLWIFPDSTDTNPQDNIHITDNLVVGAFDPNDKQVSPRGTEAGGKITLADSVLTYKVRFQNTGTGPAVNVVIIDTLDSDLNLLSFKPGLASHPYSTELEGNIATFTFSNIMLPDSNANEPESHGFIQYSIRKKSGLGYGTVIENSASIYFDFNEPVKTNTVTSTYFNFVSSVKDLETASTVSLYPNPASQKVNVVATEQMNELVITDISGSILKRFVPASVSIEIDLSELPAGIYFIAAKTAKGVRQNKLVKL